LPALAAYEEFFERGLYRVTQLGNRVALTQGTEQRETRNRWEKFLDEERVNNAPSRQPAGLRQIPALLDPLDVDEAARMLRIAALRPTQRSAIDALRGGRDVLAVMPTGSGKSAIFQTAALLESGTALVVSPLIALMDDQVLKLRKLGIAADAINHTVDGEARRRVLSDWQRGNTRFLYLSPELALDDRTLELLAHVRTSVLAIDEAHLVARWGHDFRPEYRAIGRLRAAAKPGAVVALTATATPRVREEIAVVLGMESPLEVIEALPRTNLRHCGRVFATEAVRRAALVERLKTLGPQGAIIYVEQPSRAEQLAELLFRCLDIPALPYHGELDVGKRAAVLDAFLSGRVPWVVGTKAFGLGLHRADIRLVLHAQMPDSIEMLVQGSGRAGRDGTPADIEVWSAPGDIEALVRRVKRSFVSLETIRAIHDHVKKAEGPVTVEREWLARYIGGTSKQREIEARVAISLSEQMGTLHVHGRKGTEWTVSALRWPVDASARYHDYVSVHRAARIEQLAEMVTLASSLEHVDAFTSRYFATGSIRQ